MLAASYLDWTSSHASCPSGERHRVDDSQSSALSKRLLRHICLVSLALAALGCGGGGGGGGGSDGGTTTPSPSANADSAVVDEDTSITVDVLANDSNISPTTLAVSTSPQNGSAAVDGTRIRYTPDANFHGTDTFRYRVTGTNGTSVTAEVTITVEEVNDAPTAVADSDDTWPGNPITIDLASNDTDIDGTIAGVELVDGPTQGTVSLDGSFASYTPADDATGSDSFSYRLVDDDGAESAVATVTITITAPPPTTLTVANLAIPASDYTLVPSDELSRDVLLSPIQTFTMPENPVSFVLQLSGPATGSTDDRLTFERMADPTGTALTPLYQSGAFCDDGFCTVLVPQKPGIVAAEGEWPFRLAALAARLEEVDVGANELKVAYRTGVPPDTEADFPATISVQPYLTGTELTADDLEPVLTTLTDQLTANRFNVAMAPLIIVSDPRFAEVPADFTDPITSELVGRGDGDVVNVFFIEGFSDSSGGLLGMVSGIPGSIGVPGPLNGILINALAASREGPVDFWVRTTAEFAFHEIGHFLGLFHTTEADFATHDILDDTAECNAENHDANSDGTASTEECPDGNNLMFWEIDFLTEKDPLSNDQLHVLFHSPLLRLGTE